VRQAEVAPTGKWIGDPSGGVKAPPTLILPDLATRFSRTSARLEELSADHPMRDWLHMMAQLSQAQHVVATTLEPPPLLERRLVEQAVAARLPPLAADGHHRDPVWRAGFAKLLDILDGQAMPEPAQTIVAGLRQRDDTAIEKLADGFLYRGLDAADAGAALYVAAALQVYFTCLAAELPPASLRLLPQRGLCPSCGSTPVSGIVAASGQTPGTRYLHCSLCSTAWNHVRAVCINCGESRSLSQRGVEGESGAAKAETCDSCHTYAKMFYQIHDVKVDPFADDLATLGLDLLVADAGWARSAPNPWLLISSSDKR
jgi:FdhE protein